MPMPGIKCGDLGPKLGYNSKDNGWLSFDQVRIPRSQMLMKYVSVDRDGTYRTHGDKRVLYSIMLGTRVVMAKGASLDLLKGCLIGLRYSAVRRQFKNIESKETKLLDYQTIAISQMICFRMVDKMYK
jgi:acyl-CoA oxidase